MQEEPKIVTSKFKHTPVLLKEVIQALGQLPNELLKKGHILDATVGGGGHAASILKNYPNIHLIGLDQDPRAVSAASERLQGFNGRVKIVQSNFSEFVPAEKMSFILADLGVSSPQIDEAERGFSFQKDGPLDMRFNRNQELTCSDIIENYSESELSEILWKLGEEEESRRIAKFIVERREVKKFKSTTDLANVIKLAKRKRTKKHSATKSFQALRMAVNSELESLSKCLEVLKNKLKKSGKIVVISFHSLEDRIAKQSFKTQPNLVEKKIPIFNDTTREKFTVSKVLLPTNDEISMNPRSRSAKMRVIKKL